MENSIKEDIKIVENYLANSAMNEIDSNFFKNSGWETVDLEIPKSMQHILSDYKRVLKENEELKADNYELNNRINDLLDNISVQKVKDRIEKYKKLSDKFYVKFLESDRYNTDIREKGIKCDAIILELEELIEERKVK